MSYKRCCPGSGEGSFLSFGPFMCCCVSRKESKEMLEEHKKDLQDEIKVVEKKIKDISKKNS